MPKPTNFHRLTLVVSSLMVASTISLSGCSDSSTTTTEAKQAPKSDSPLAPETSAPSTTPPMSAEDTTGKVLRHAVFFSFKETSTPAQIQEVVDAFAALPSKISEIIDFQYGTNNSPEGLNDGFTHCFLLTFANEAGRTTYLPHEAHKAFGDVLRPHMKDVFVIDYWGTESNQTPEKALQHVVFFRFKEDAAQEDITKVEDAFAALPEKIESIKGFEWGKNNSQEKHDDGFTHCFLVTFDSEEGRATYLPHPEHTAFVEVLKPVLDAPRVLDFWTE